MKKIIGFTLLGVALLVGMLVVSLFVLPGVIADRLLAETFSFLPRLLEMVPVLREEVLPLLLEGDSITVEP